MEKPSNKITIKILLIFSLPLLFVSITNVLAIESVEDYVFDQILSLIVAHMANGKQNFGDCMSILNQTNLLLLLITNQLNVYY